MKRLGSATKQRGIHEKNRGEQGLFNVKNNLPIGVEKKNQCSRTGGRTEAKKGGGLTTPTRQSSFL